MSAAETTPAGERPDRITYDNYPGWMALLVDLSTGVAGAPIEEMLAVNVRMGIAGAYVTPAGAEPASPEQVDRQRRILEAAQRFRDDFRQAVQP